MSSSSRPRRSRYRFGFEGKRPRRNTQAATTDEILDSLTRQARLMERGSEERTIGRQTILEDEPSEDLLPSRLELRSTAEGMKSRNFGKVAFATMLVVGLTLLWISSKLSLSQIVSLEDLAILQQTMSRAGFTDWRKIALMAICAFTIALVVRRSTLKMRSRILSTI